MIIKKCEFCGKDMELKTVNKKNAKNYGELIKIHKNKKFCSTKCQIEWQKNSNWEDRVGKEVADKIRKETSERVSGNNNPTCNPETAKKVSDSLKKYLKEHPEERKGENNAFYGRKHKDETIEHWRETKKGIYFLNEEQHLKRLENIKRGEDSHLWKGGISFEPYSPEFNKCLKTKIKERDSYKCCICNKETQKLAIHHINYNKENSNEKNLISLCYSCHSKTNINREIWEKIFVNLINEKYDNLTEYNSE